MKKWTKTHFTPHLFRLSAAIYFFCSKPRSFMFMVCANVPLLPHFCAKSKTTNLFSRTCRPYLWTWLFHFVFFVEQCSMPKNVTLAPWTKNDSTKIVRGKRVYISRASSITCHKPFFSSSRGSTSFDLGVALVLLVIGGHHNAYRECCRLHRLMDHTPEE